MSAGPQWSALLSGGGTQFARSINGLNSTWAGGMTANAAPFGKGGIGNPAESAIPNMGGTSSYNPARGPALGAMDQTNFHLFTTFNDGNQHRSTMKQLVWVSRNSIGIAHEARSWSALNHLCASDLGIKVYGEEFVNERLLEDHSFYGAPITNTPLQLMDAGEKCAGFHIGKRARIFNVASCISPHCGSSPAVSVGDHLYGLWKRISVPDEIDNVFGTTSVRSLIDSSVRSVKKEAGRFCWQLFPYVSHDRQPPPSYLYQTELGIGSAVFIGLVWTVYGNPFINSGAIEQSRNVMQPANDDAGYLNEMKLGFEIDVLLGVR